DSTATNPTWVNITANLKALTHNSFGDPTLTETQAKSLTALAADWRYAIPDDLNNPTGPTHPVLYVSGDSGVYRSFDKGKTWKLFPNQDDDLAPADGGYLPNVHISDLDLAVGNINPTTGRPTVKGSPDVLLATTYGRSSFAIRIAPVVVPGTLRLVGTPAALQPLTFSGISEATSFGNTVRVSIYDLTTGTPIYKAGWNGTDSGTGTDNSSFWTDSKGAFSIQVAANAIVPMSPIGMYSIMVSALTPGVHAITATATDIASNVSSAPSAALSITIDVTPPAVPSAPDMVDASDSGASNTDNITNVQLP